MGLSEDFEVSLGHLYPTASGLTHEQAMEALRKFPAIDRHTNERIQFRRLAEPNQLTIDALTGTNPVSYASVSLLSAEDPPKVYPTASGLTHEQAMEALRKFPAIDRHTNERLQFRRLAEPNQLTIDARGTDFFKEAIE